MNELLRLPQLGANADALIQRGYRYGHRHRAGQPQGWTGPDRSWAASLTALLTMRHATSTCPDFTVGSVDCAIRPKDKVVAARDLKVLARKVGVWHETTHLAGPSEPASWAAAASTGTFPPSASQWRTGVTMVALGRQGSPRWPFRHRRTGGNLAMCASDVQGGPQRAVIRSNVSGRFDS